MSIASRLDRAFAQAPILPLNKCSRYVLISDCHRGVGTSLIISSRTNTSTMQL